ncbi:MAG: extracellular solute-binding protein [Bdellovibrionales bacterium]
MKQLITVIAAMLATTTLLLSASVSAQENVQEKTSKFGLAMHGAPKYNNESAHLDYVNPTAPKSGNKKLAAIGTFDTINPYSIKGKAAQGLNLTYDRLMRRVWDEAFTMYPLIAESYEMPDDRSSITFHINPKARFHDGTPITADDVIFSFETLKNHGRPNMRRVYKLVSKAELKGDNSVYFKFGEGYDRETALILAIMPILSKSYWQDKEFDTTTLSQDIPMNGPYKIKTIDIGRSISYQRVDDYWAKDLMANIGHYNIDEITYDYFRDNNVAFEAFSSGDISIRRESDPTKWAQNYDFPAVKNSYIIKKTLPHSRPEKTRGMIFNTRREPFNDIKVRQAFSLMLDHKKINNLIFNGKKKEIRSYFPNSEFDTCQNCEIETPPSTRERMRFASNLLKESGWNIIDGKQSKNDQALSFELLLQSPEDEKIALHLKQSLKRIGINMRIRVTDSADFLRRLRAYDYDMVLHHWQSSLSPGTEQLLYWGCDAAKQEGRFNYAGICTPEIDTLASAVANTKDRIELVKTMQTLDEKLLEGHYMIPLFYIGQDYVAHNKDIQHPETTPLYGMVLETWWIENQQSKNTVE